MNSEKPRQDPIYDPESDAVYSLNVIAELAGVSTTTVLHYHELGVIKPASEGLEFDAEGLRQLRRFVHLRQAHALTDSGLQFVAGLLSEVERLRQESRQTRKFSSR